MHVHYNEGTISLSMYIVFATDMYNSLPFTFLSLHPIAVCVSVKQCPGSFPAFMSSSDSKLKSSEFCCLCV